MKPVAKGGSKLAAALRPRLRVQPLPHRPLAARFTVAGPLPDSDDPIVWKIGGGGPERPVRAFTGVFDQVVRPVEVTLAPSTILSPQRSVVLDFTKRVSPKAAYTDIAVTASGGGLTTPLEHTVRAFSTYYLARQLGTLRLPVVDQDLVGGEGLLSIRFVVRNHEDEAVTFTSRTLEFLHLRTADEGPGPGDPGATDVVVPAQGTAEVRVALTHLPSEADGVGVHLLGASASGIPARAAAFFEIPGGWKPSRRPVPVTGHEWDDPRLWRVIDEQVKVIDPDVSWQIVQDMSLELDRSAESETVVLRHHPGPPVAGAVCHAGDADTETLVCAATGTMIWTEVPGRVLNARRGDIVLFVGTRSSPMAAMGGALSPPHQFAHCGMVIRDHEEIRHCFASADWLMAQRPLTGDHIPEEDMRFVWPGTVNQTVDEMANGSEFLAPDGETYTIGSWFFDDMPAAVTALAPPVVVRPPAELEAVDPAIRAQLRAVADAAEAIHAHFRWVTHTTGDFTLTKGPEPMPEWAQIKPAASMCSDFMWLAARAAGVTFEGAGPEASDILPPPFGRGAELSSTDGLYRYRAPERLAAGFALRDFIVEKVKEGAPGFAEPLVLGIAERITNQLLNAFGTDDVSTATADPAKPQPWQLTPGEGRTVFPQDILSWDSPALGGAYGDMQELIYRAPHFEQVPEWRWQVKTGTATVSGRVLLGTTPHPGADIFVNDVHRGHSDVDGNYIVGISLTAEDPPFRLSARDETLATEPPVEITLDPGDHASGVDLVLAGVPVDRRLVTIHGEIEIAHDVFEFTPPGFHVRSGDVRDSKVVVDDGSSMVVPGWVEADVIVDVVLTDADTGEVRVEVEVPWRHTTKVFFLPDVSGRASDSATVAAEAQEVLLDFPFTTGLHDLKLKLFVTNGLAKA